jgi:NAD(P)H-dependent flavin oxidoreductase YrpB (nitropropane dioxygenase family)
VRVFTGVQLGTRFVAVEEYITHPVYKKADDIDNGDAHAIISVGTIREIVSAETAIHRMMEAYRAHSML